MSDWPEWFQEALRQRFYQIELASEQQASCSSEDNNLFTQMDQFKMNQNEDIQHLLSEWEEAIGYQLSQDKQSIYNGRSKRRDSIDSPRHTPHSYSLVYLSH
ncbi:hypothetical protein [Paenibacillus peoriae]|uniref:hypothetical protein n=1 Tax=Paenibacillus peoriae TaxID=59893 RepID=UPI00211610A0|nr:hypothetical protein [Paenibacillus peoriae]